MLADKSLTGNLTSKMTCTYLEKPLRDSCVFVGVFVGLDDINIALLFWV